MKRDSGVSLVEFCGGGDVVGGQWLQPDGEERCDAKCLCRSGVEGGSSAGGRDAVPLEPLPLTPSGGPRQRRWTEPKRRSPRRLAPRNRNAARRDRPAQSCGTAGERWDAEFSFGFPYKVTGGSRTTSPSPPATPPEIQTSASVARTPVQLPSGNTPPANLPRGNFPPVARPRGRFRDLFQGRKCRLEAGRRHRRPADDGRRQWPSATGQPRHPPGSPTIAGRGRDGGKAKIVTGSGKDLGKATTGVVAPRPRIWLGMGHHARGELLRCPTIDRVQDSNPLGHEHLKGTN